MKNLILSVLLICGTIATNAHSQGTELPKLEEPKKPPTIDEIFEKSKASWNKNGEIAKEITQKQMQQALKDRNESLADREARKSKPFNLGYISCFRSNKRATFSCAYDRWFVINGEFDRSTGRVTKIWHVVQEDVREVAMRRCIVKPEWGKDYIDEKCVKAYEKTIEDFAVGEYKSLTAVSAYRFAQLNHMENEFDEE